MTDKQDEQLDFQKARLAAAYQSGSGRRLPSLGKAARACQDLVLATLDAAEAEIAWLKLNAEMWQAAYRGLQDKRNRITRINEDDSPGGLDEIVGVGEFHVERMDKNHVWASFGGHGFEFFAERGARGATLYWAPQSPAELRAALEAARSASPMTHQHDADTVS